MNGKCFIVGASKDSQEIFEYSKNDYIIAADGGYDFLVNNNMRGDLLIGDLDSIKSKVSFKNTIVLPKEKDESDLNRCIGEAIRLGYKELIIYGAMGGRIDHSIAAIQDSSGYSKMNVEITFKYKEKTLRILRNSTFEIERESGYISIFAIEKSSGVSISNLKYEITNKDLTPDFALGLSNEFINKKATISVKDGCLLIVY